MLIFRRSKLYFTASGIVTLCEWPCSAPVESGPLSTGALYGRSQSVADDVKYNFDLLKMSIVFLETCRGI
jgi:hypothetical protein